MQSAEQEKLETVFQELCPFLRWLRESSRVQQAELGFGFFNVTGMSMKLLPRNGKGPELCLRFYVPRKLPPSELNQDWDMVWKQFQEYGSKLRFGSLVWDKPEIAIPPSIMGYPTDVFEA